MNRYGKDQCLHKDWHNVKEITAEELAYCIYKYDLTEPIPESRMIVVKEEIEKLLQQEKIKKERILIEAELAMYEHVDDGTFMGKRGEEIIGYYLDPDLFYTSWEATVAKSELNSCWNTEIYKIEEYNHKYKNARTHPRDTKNLIKAMKKVKNQYVKLGGSKADFEQCISQLPIPTKGTLHQDVYANRERIKEDFIHMGASPTRANKIAIAITAEAYLSLI